MKRVRRGWSPLGLHPHFVFPYVFAGADDESDGETDDDDEAAYDKVH